MTFSPNSNAFEDLLMNEENIWIDGDVESINPDEFLNLNEFLPERNIKTEPECVRMETCTYTQLSPQQLTPPISPQPVFIESGGFQKVKLVPVRVLKKQEAPSREVKKIPPKIIPKPSSSSESDSTAATVIKSPTSPVDKALIKQQRLIRNRESAIMSRNKKKQMFIALEAENQKLIKENSFLKAENFQLKARLSNYSALTCRCASKISSKLPSKNATVMMAVLFMVGFNVIPVKNFFFKGDFRESQASLQQINTRHLLSIKNSSNSNRTSSEEPSEPKTATYFNQTDHIRKVNIDNIRRWIPEPDLFNISSIKKNFDFNPDPLQEKLAKMYEKSREQSQKHLKTKKRPQKKKPVVGPMQLYNSNLNIIKLNEFFDEINRKDDTFYVFSFNADHLLLPAIDSNYKFSQIKMNLIMPRSNGECYSIIVTSVTESR